MTSEERVRAKWPDDVYLSGDYSTISPALDTFNVIMRLTGKTLGSGPTRKAAWQDAEKRMEGRDGNK